MSEIPLHWACWRAERSCKMGYTQLARGSKPLRIYMHRMRTTHPCLSDPFRVYSPIIPALFFFITLKPRVE